MLGGKMLKLSIELLQDCSEDEQAQAFIWLFSRARDLGVLHQWEAKARFAVSSTYTTGTSKFLKEKQDKPQNKIRALKAIRNGLDIFLKEAKDQLDALQLTIPRGFTIEAFDALEKELGEAGYIIQ